MRKLTIAMTLALLTVACETAGPTPAPTETPPGVAVGNTPAPVAAPSLTTGLDPWDPPPTIPVPRPSPASFPARTPEEARAGFLRDPFVYLGDRELGLPVYVTGFGESLDVWVAPLIERGAVIGAYSASVKAGQTASVGMYSGFTGPFPHSLSGDQALRLGSAPSDPGISVQLVWTRLGNRRGYLSDTNTPTWHVVRRSGLEMLIYSDGLVLPLDDPSSVRFPALSTLPTMRLPNGCARSIGPGTEPGVWSDLQVCSGIGRVGNLLTVTGMKCSYPGAQVILVFGSEGVATTGTYGSWEIGRFDTDRAGHFQVTFAIPARLNTIQGYGGGGTEPGTYRVYSKPSVCGAVVEVR